MDRPRRLAPLLPDAQRDPAGDGRRRGGHREEHAEPEASDHPLGEEWRDRRPRESRDPVESERPAPPRGRHQVDHERVVRDEEAREAEALEHPDGGEQRNPVRHGGEERGEDDERDAGEHEGLPADGVGPGADQRLADDADRVVEAHDEPDLDLRPAERRDVERQQDEAVHAQEEEEVGDRRPEERIVS